MSTFKATLSICGLTYAQAADFLSERLGRHLTKETVYDMARGKTFVNADIWAEMVALHQRIEEAADYASSMLEPGLMDRRAMNNVQADDGANPLPGVAADIAGAIALLSAIRDTAE